MQRHAGTLLRSLAAAALILAPNPAAQAATIEARPGTLQHALGSAEPGDAVLLRSGRYRDEATVPDYDGSVLVAPYPEEEPVLTNVKLRGGRHLEVRGFLAERLTVSGTRHLVLADNDFTASGVWLDHTDDLRFVANRIHDSMDGLVLDDSSRFVIEGNECWNVPLPRRRQSGDCIQMARTEDWTIRGNHFHGQPAKPHVDAIEITDDNADGVISHNRFRSFRGIVFTPGDATPLRDQHRMTVVNNLFVTRQFALVGVRMHDSRFLYNTVTDRGRVQFGGRSSGNVVVGNVMPRFFVDPRRAREVVPVEDHNLVRAVRGGYRLGPHSIRGTARFADAAAGDYRLAPDSPGIAAGDRAWMPVDDLVGVVRQAPDIGALAYTG